MKDLVSKRLLPAELRIVEVKGQAVKSSATTVQINKINVKGLWFQTELLFPVNASILLNFQVIILNETIQLRGTVLSSQLENKNYLYEVAFIKDDGVKKKLSDMLENLARQFVPQHLKAEYYYNYFSESTYDFKNNQINLLC